MHRDSNTTLSVYLTSRDEENESYLRHCEVSIFHFVTSASDSNILHVDFTVKLQREIRLRESFPDEIKMKSFSHRTDVGQL